MIYRPYDGSPESIMLMQEAAVSPYLTDRAQQEAITATAQVINQIGCADVIGRLKNNGVLEAVGSSLLFKQATLHSNLLLAEAAASDIIKPSSPGIRPATFVDEVEAMQTMDAAFINSSVPERDHSTARRGAAINFEFNYGGDLRDLREAMPHLASTRVFAIGSGNATLSTLWGLSTFGIGTSSGATQLVSEGRIGGIWDDPAKSGVSRRSKNNPVALTLGSPYARYTIPGSADLVPGSGQEISKWARSIADAANINMQPYTIPGSVTPENGKVVSCEQNPDYSFTVRWTDKDGRIQTTETDIVIGGLGLQTPLDFITPRVPMLDAGHNQLVADPETKGMSVEIYQSANKDVTLRVHRWQEDLDASQLDRMFYTHGTVIICGLGNSSIEMMRQFEEDDIPYLVLTDSPARVIHQPEKTHLFNGKAKRLARNKDPYEFDLQNGVAYDLPAAKRLIDNNSKILTGVKGVRWLPSDNNGLVKAEIYFGDGRQPKIVEAQEDVYGMYGYGIDTDAAERLGMVVTKSGKVLTDACGQIKASDSTTHVGFLTMGGHIEGGANKGIVPGFINMLPSQIFAAIAQAERRYMMRQNASAPSLGRIAMSV